jgi:hypothetical protein
MQIIFTNRAQQAAWDRFWDEMLDLVKADIAAKVREEHEQPVAKSKRRKKATA